MTEDISASLAMLDVALKRLGRKVLLEALQDGLTAESVQSMIASIGLNSTPELEEVYGWHNGVAPGGRASLDDVHLFPGFYLLPLDEVIANYRTFVVDDRWATGWLPVFGNGGGDFYVVDLSSTGAGAVRRFWIDELDHPIEFSSLSSMMATLAEGFHREVFYVDDRGYLEMDDLVFGALATEMNPDVTYWRDLT